jgi:photosystem I P700 chlorophyll a apoprotein A2
MVGSFAHACIYLIRDYAPHNNVNATTYITGIIVSHKAAVISHLSYISLWLGIHTLGLYIHNDSVVAFGDEDKQIVIDPVFAQCIQAASGKVLYLGSSSLTLGSSIFLPLSTSDLLAHHSLALGLHVTALILVKGALDATGSKLVPDKLAHGFGYPCDGPGRGGTCDVSAWDSVYLALFWMLNTIAWCIFYFHFKHLSLWLNNDAFNDTGCYLNGWFVNYLWFNSAALIHGYDSSALNDLSVWSWLFLGAHLTWATGFMFLISWRGYWQELIDTIVWAHLLSPVVGIFWNGAKHAPVALSIVQARFVGVVHFAVGFILSYPPFIVGATS